MFWFFTHGQVGRWECWRRKRRAAGPPLLAYTALMVVDGLGILYIINNWR